jgi:hypothetical protein
MTPERWEQVSRVFAGRIRNLLALHKQTASRPSSG